MTITQAQAVNNLLDYFVRQSVDPDRKITSEQAERAARILADAAHKAISAGWTGEGVSRFWARREKTGDQEVGDVPQ